jgi:uncharacterized membrane protein YdjX (TVP38/TMEM64 family)
MVLWILLCMPSTICEVLGGFLFHFWPSLVALTVAKELACCLAFLIGRRVGGNALERHFSGDI